MKSKFSKVMVVTLIVAFAVMMFFFVNTTANAANIGKTATIAQADDGDVPPPDKNGGPGGQGGPNGAGKHNGKGKRGGNGKMQTAMFEVFKKYAGDPAFKTMLNEQQELMESMMQARQAKMKQHRAQMQDLMLQYAIKAKAAKTDEEQQQIMNEMKTKFKAMREKGKTEGKSAMDQMKTKMDAFKSKYESKFPDYFKVIEEMIKHKGPRKGGPRSGNKAGNKGPGGPEGSGGPDGF